MDKEPMSKVLKTNCPSCNKTNTWHEDNRFKPFCSSRCKLIDLGEWANETRVIAGASVSDWLIDEDQYED